MTAETKLEPFNVNVRIKISALWTSMLFVFAYVDLFSLYRPDFRADIEAGEIAGFTINQSFLLGTTVYVVIPSLMVFCALILRPRVNRIANIVLAIVYALTIVVGAIGEWSYYILGSAIEVALLAAIVYYAWTWPRETPPTSTTGREATHDIQPTALEPPESRGAGHVALARARFARAAVSASRREGMVMPYLSKSTCQAGTMTPAIGT